MTENQRDYLADLALAKGVKLTDTDNKSAAWASAKIEELKTLSDADFDEITDEQVAKINVSTQRAVEELHKWGFDNG